MNEQAGTDGNPERTPDFIPGWFRGRAIGDVAEQTREAVRIVDPAQFPLGFLHADEFVRPARPPERGVTIAFEDRAMSLAVPPGYWIVRAEDGRLYNWADSDFKERFTRIRVDWVPPVSRKGGEVGQDDRDLPCPPPTGGFGSDAPVSALGLPKQIHITAPPVDYPNALIGPADFIVQDFGLEGIKVVKDRSGFAGHRPASTEEVGRCVPLTPKEAYALAERIGWRGTPPAEGTRRRLILDQLYDSEVTMRNGEGGILSSRSAMALADDIESALLQSTIAEEAKKEHEPTPAERVSAAIAAGAVWSVPEEPENVDDESPPEHLRASERKLWDAGQGRFLLRKLSTARGRCRELGSTLDERTTEREEARGGEDHFKAQRDSALRLVRWLIGDVVDTGLASDGLDGEAEAGELRDNPHLPDGLRERAEKQLAELAADREEDHASIARLEIAKALNHVCNALFDRLGL